MGLNIQDLAIHSPDFNSHGRIGEEFSAGGGNVPPRLRISGIPTEAVDLAVICHDPDAPLPHGFTHWVLYGLPVDARDLEVQEGSCGVAGPNGIGEKSYIGPEPPAGHGLHHYYFWVYALSRKVEGEPTREEFLDKYAGHIIEQNRVIGTFER